MALVSKNIITESTKITFKDLANTYSKSMSDTISQISKSANFMMSSSALSFFVESGGTKNTSEVSDLATMFLSTQTSYEDISIVDEEGTVLYSSNSDLIGTNVAGEEYFTSMVTSGLSTQGSLYTSETSGETCVTFAIPIRNNMEVVGKIQGIENNDTNLSISDIEGLQEGPMAMDTDTIPPDTTENPASLITPDTTGNMNFNNNEEPVENFTGAIITSVNLSAFDKILSNITVANYSSGFAFILSSTGDYIYHTDATLIGTNVNVAEINRLLDKVQNGTYPESDIITYTYNGVKKYASFDVNEDSQWTVFVGADQSEILESLNALASNTLLTTVVLVLLISTIAYIVTGRITKSIKRIVKLINKTADLDFTEDKSFEHLSKQHDEIGEISRAIEGMRSELKTMILHLSNVSSQISESSDNLNTI